YSVAATLFFLLTGRAPHQGQDATSTLARIVSDPAPSVRSLRPDIPPDLDRIILRGLERTKDRRWKDLEALRAALVPFAPGRLAIGGVGLRVAASVIDIYLTKFVVMTAIAIVEVVSRRGKVQDFADNWAIDVVLDIVIYLVFFGIMESSWGFSPGKWLLGLRVRGVDAAAQARRNVWLRTFIFWVFSGLSWEALAITGLVTNRAEA